MKKIIAVLMSLTLLMSFAFAEGAPKTYNWSDVEAQALETPGAFFHLGNTGIKMYIPETIHENALTQEQLDGGDFLFMSNDDSSIILRGQVLPVSRETFNASLREKGAEISDAVLNGISCSLIQVVSEENAHGIVLVFDATESQKVIVLTLSPVTDENNATIQMMIGSVQTADQ